MSARRNRNFKLRNVGKRGQVVLPSAYRKALRISDETDVQITLEQDKITIRPVKIFPIRSSLAGSSSLREKVLDSYKEAKKGKFISEDESNALFQTQVEVNTTEK